MQTGDATIEFEDFTVDSLAAELRRDGKVISVEPQVFDIIRFLAENPERLVTRDDLIEQVWNGRIVTDAAISTRINAARQALGDDGKQQRVIKTVPRRGFRFVAETRVAPTQDRNAKPDDDPQSGGKLQLPDRPSIVVTPFECISEDAESRQLADGLRIDIQNALIKVSGAFLIAAGSANAVRGMPPGDAATTLGVRYVLEGRAQRAIDQVRFSVSLFDALAGRYIWSEQFDRQLGNTFELLDEVTQRVLTSTNVELIAGEPARVWHKTLRDLKSLEAFYRGVSSFFQMNKQSLASARSDFEFVADRHPDLSIGPTWVSLTHWYDLQRGWADSAPVSRDLARQWAEKASTLEDADGQADTVLSHVLLLERRFEDAIAAGENAVRNRPSCTHANGFYANVLHHCGLQEDALRHIELAMRYSPIHPPLFNVILASIQRALGNHGAAASAASEAINAAPDDVSARLLMAIAMQKLGQPGSVAEQVEEVRQKEPHFSVASFANRQLYQSDAFAKALASDLMAAGFPP